eukprot:365627-Chlamydomonas_euryale.AAC.3
MCEGGRGYGRRMQCMSDSVVVFVGREPTHSKSGLFFAPSHMCCRQHTAEWATGHAVACTPPSGRPAMP